MNPNTNVGKVSLDTSTDCKPFTCRVDNNTKDGLLVEGVVIASKVSGKKAFDVQAFINDRFYTFCIVEQGDKQFMLRLVRVHDRTGTFCGLNTMLLSDSSVENLFQQALTELATK